MRDQKKATNLALNLFVLMTPKESRIQENKADQF